METTITLINDGTSWLAKYSGAQAATIIELFGTDTIATAFRAQASSSVVLAAIARLNPDCTVNI